MQILYFFRGQFKIDIGDDMKKYEQIYNKYRNDILQGFLKNKQQLPSIRESCQIFKASQTTVEHAYDKLCIEGYITSKPHIGYFVSINQTRIRLHQQLDSYQSMHQDIDYIYDFRSQTISQDSFEISTWKRYLKDVLDNKKELSTYGDSQGELELREAICHYTYKIRGVLTHPEHILIGSNYQSLLFILAGLIPKNSIIAMEYQDYSQAKRVFESYGFQIVMIRSLDDGIDLRDLRMYDVDFLYINSACQGLKKKPMSQSLKEKLIQYTQGHHITIIEDDYNGELTYASKDHYAMQCMSNCDHVIYCGSFSRLLLPSLRISYLVFNKHYYDKYKDHKHEYGPTASKLEQLAFSKYISDGYLVKHVKKLKKEYKEKNKIMLKTLEKYYPYSFYLDEAYLCYHIELPQLNETHFMKLCKTNKIAVNPIMNQQLSLSFASIPSSHIHDALITIKKIIEQCYIF